MGGGQLLTMEDVGYIMNGMAAHTHPGSTACLTLVVPVNLKDRDAFHLTIEEYLLALVSLIDELVCSPYSNNFILVLTLT